MQISSVNYKDLNPEFRIDAEYYRAEILDRLNILENHNKDTLNNLVDFVAGPFGSTVTVDKYVEQSDYRYIRNKNINDFRINNNDLALIPEEVWSSLPQFHIQENDLLITVVGTLGKVAIASGKDNNSIFSCKSTILRTREINPFFLLTYLNSDSGKLFSLRGKRGAIQEGLNLTDLKEIQVVIPSNRFQSAIEETVRSSFARLEDSEETYKEAQTILLSELGLTNWQPKHRISFIKNYSDTVQAGRIDAGYFQPFYEEIGKKLQSTGFVLIKDICNKINYGSVPTSPYSEDNKGTPYIKGLNLRGLQVNTEKLDYITNTQDLKNKVFTKEGDIIISQMGTVGNCGVVSTEQENWIFASFTIRIRISDKTKYDPYFVALYIENVAKPYYLMRNIAQASVRQNTDLPTIKNMPIPDFPIEKQKQLSKKVTESFNLRKQSRHLLERAKRAVEMAIEQDEIKAIDWLKERTQDIGVLDADGS